MFAAWVLAARQEKPLVVLRQQLLCVLILASKLNMAIEFGGIEFEEEGSFLRPKDKKVQVERTWLDSPDLNSRRLGERIVLAPIDKEGSWAARKSDQVWPNSAVFWHQDRLGCTVLAVANIANGNQRGNSRWVSSRNALVDLAVMPQHRPRVAEFLNLDQKKLFDLNNEEFIAHRTRLNECIRAILLSDGAPADFSNGVLEVNWAENPYTVAILNNLAGFHAGTAKGVFGALASNDLHRHMKIAC